MPNRKKCEDADVNAVTTMLFHNDMIAVLTEEFLELKMKIRLFLLSRISIVANKRFEYRTNQLDRLGLP
jgi:hypothetical protein